MRLFHEVCWILAVGAVLALLVVGLTASRPAEAQVPQDRIERYLERIARSMERIARQPVCECECR